MEAFWASARREGPTARWPDQLPSVWSFGSDPDQADGLLQLVLDGTKTATASAREDYDFDEEPLPEPGTLSIVTDGSGRPRALLTVTEVAVVPFDQVGEGHAWAEGEGLRTLADRRRGHEASRRHDPHGRGFRPDMPLVLERFEVLYRA